MRFLVGVLVGFVVAGVPVYAYRTEKPPTFDEKWNSNTITQLNNVLLQLWNVTNGRVSMDAVTSDPDGTLPGDVGDERLYNNAGTYSHCLNVDGAKTWKCVTLS